MAATNSGVDDVLEYCEECDGETAHHVSLDLLTESTKRENAEFSREPYRVSECRQCGATEETRMNNA